MWDLLEALTRPRCTMYSVGVYSTLYIHDTSQHATCDTLQYSVHTSQQATCDTLQCSGESFRRTFLSANPAQRSSRKGPPVYIGWNRVHPM